MLAELEEIIDYKQINDQPSRQAHVRQTWISRLKGCQRNVDVWQRILKVRSLVMTPSEDKEMYIKFSSLCRKSGRFGLSAKTLSNLLIAESDFNNLNLTMNEPLVIYASLKHLWESGGRESAYAQLKSFTAHLVDKIGIYEEGYNLENLHSDPVKEKLAKLIARCFLKTGNWQISLQDNWDETNIQYVLKSYQSATQCDNNWYQAWHAWALSNFEVVEFYERSKEKQEIDVLLSHIVSSVDGIFLFT